MAAIQTKKNSSRNKKIDFEYIDQVLEKYGQYRKNDLIKEHQHQFVELDNLIDAFRANGRTYSYSKILELFEKNLVRERGPDEVPDIDGRKYVSAGDLGAFAYKIGLISRLHDNGINFTHFSDDPDLFKSRENKEDKVTWSVHLAYRKYLNIR